MRLFKKKNFNRSNFDTTLLIIEHGDIYFGGLPKGFKTPQGALASTAYFVGCISDVTIGGQLVNFANSTDRKNAVLDNCHRDALGELMHFVFLFVITRNVFCRFVYALFDRFFS